MDLESAFWGKRQMNSVFDRLFEAISAIWPRADQSKLPDRVSGAIARNDDISEVLVKVIQFGVFTLWGVVYLAAPVPNPKPFPAFRW